MVEIAARAEAELPLLFGQTKGLFAGLPGWSDQRVLKVLSGDLVFVAREQGQPAGCVALRREDDGAFVIEQLFVAPGHERRGIGHRLLAYAEGYAIAERARVLRIVVEEGNGTGSQLLPTLRLRAGGTGAVRTHAPQRRVMQSGRWREWQPEP
jgi:ribosomal protein S18 acetylase RimI-like enzyme